MNKLILHLFLLFVCSFSYGALQDHLKPAEGKGDDHKIRNIDFIYMINLDQRPQKYALSKQYLKKYGINPYRFSAINGWELSIEEIHDVGLKYQPGMTPLLATSFVVEEGIKLSNHEFMKEYGKTYFVHCMAFGTIGCALSHISVLQDAYDSGYETIWVMEDDIEILDNPHKLSDLIDELDALVGVNNWDVLFTDCDYRSGVGKYVPAYGATKRPDMDCSLQERYSNKYKQKIQINKHFRKIGARFGTTSMIIRRSGIIKLLEFSKTRNIYLPYDLENCLPVGIQRYGLTFDLVTNMLNSLSDNGVQGYLNSF
ncbi:MAG: glycosyltransferase family 25 protein [Candidatus Rhabdochlamydia sp.]